MHLKSTSFGFGSIAMFAHIETSVALLLTFEVNGRNYLWADDAIKDVFKAPAKVKWVGTCKAFIMVELSSSLRDPDGLLRSFASKLKTAFRIRESEYWDHDLEREEAEEYDPHGFYKEEPVEVNLGGDPGGFKIYE